MYVRSSPITQTTVDQTVIKITIKYTNAAPKYVQEQLVYSRTKQKVECIE